MSVGLAVNTILNFLLTLKTIINYEKVFSFSGIGTWYGIMSD